MAPQSVHRFLRQSPMPARSFFELVLQGLHLAHLRVLTTDPTGWQFSPISRTDANSFCSRSLDRQLHSAQETV
jgi:hypothetical protein